jgi:hypothetical protein
LTYFLSVQVVSLTVLTIMDSYGNLT